MTSSRSVHPSVDTGASWVLALVSPRQRAREGQAPRHPRPRPSERHPHAASGRTARVLQRVEGAPHGFPQWPLQVLPHQHSVPCLVDGSRPRPRPRPAASVCISLTIRHVEHLASTCARPCGSLGDRLLGSSGQAVGVTSIRVQFLCVCLSGHFKITSRKVIFLDKVLVSNVCQKELVH